MTRRTFPRLRRWRLAVLSLLRDAGPLCLWQVAHRLGRMHGAFVASEPIEVALRTLAVRGRVERCAIHVETATGPGVATGWAAARAHERPANKEMRRSAVSDRESP